MPLHTLQLSYIRTRRRVPQVLVVTVFALCAWSLVWALAKCVL